MAAVVADTCGRHNTSSRACSRKGNIVRFDQATRCLHACRENVILEFARHGLTKPEIVPNVDFSRTCQSSPRATWRSSIGVSAPGD